MAVLKKCVDHMSVYLLGLFFFCFLPLFAWHCGGLDRGGCVAVTFCRFIIILVSCVFFNFVLALLHGDGIPKIR